METAERGENHAALKSDRKLKQENDAERDQQTLKETELGFRRARFLLFEEKRMKDAQHKGKVLLVNRIKRNNHFGNRRRRGGKEWSAAS